MSTSGLLPGRAASGRWAPGALSCGPVAVVVLSWKAPGVGVSSFWFSVTCSILGGPLASWGVQRGGAGKEEHAQPLSASSATPSLLVKFCAHSLSHMLHFSVLVPFGAHRGCLPFSC